ncbi:MAG: hypothetical protein V3T55_04925 [Anaerolineales bacterium]
MKDKHLMSNVLFGATGAMVVMAITTVAMATEPCEDFGECKVLIEINSTDGDIGFHFLVDGDDLNSTRIHDPNGAKVFEDYARGPLREQKLTETFAESAEPLCWMDPEAEEDWEDIVTLEEFLDRWAEGTYVFSGSGDEGEKLTGETNLTYELPAAPKDLMFNDKKGVISWAAGDDLGNCASFGELTALVTAGVLSTHPGAVEVDAWEVVFEPDVDDGIPLGQLKFTIRVSGDLDDFAPLAVTVPQEYLDSLPNDTPAKIEVGAIGGEDNATFTEIFDICVNEDEGCEEEE